MADGPDSTDDADKEHSNRYNEALKILPTIVKNLQYEHVVRKISAVDVRTPAAAVRYGKVRALMNESGKLAGSYSSAGDLMKMSACFVASQ